MSIWNAAFAHVSLFYIRHTFFLGKDEHFAKVRKLVGLCVRFYLFQYVILSISHNCLANLPWMLPENGWFQLSTYDNICISNRQESEPGAQQNLWCEILEF